MCKALLTAVLVLVVAGLVAGCGGGKKGDGDGGGKTNLTKGRKLFQQNCGSCHTLADAKKVGSFGPDLDTLPLDEERVRLQIESGGGGMPEQLVTGKDADTLAAYVAEVAGKGGE